MGRLLVGHFSESQMIEEMKSRYVHGMRIAEPYEWIARIVRDVIWRLYTSLMPMAVVKPGGILIPESSGNGIMLFG
jgi:hypothetical protein